MSTQQPKPADLFAAPAAAPARRPRARRAAVSAKPAKPPSPVHQLRIEIEAARGLLASLGDILGDDVQARADAVEGETQLRDWIDSAVKRIGEIELLEAGIKASLAAVDVRKHRLSKQKELLRTWLIVAMETALVPSLETSLATITLKATPRQVDIVEEPMIPGKYWVAQEPRLDRVAVREDLKAGIVVPGAVLDNGGQTIQIKWS